MANAEFMGSIFIGTWVTSDGTTGIDTDSRNFTYTETVDLIDATAGADTGKRNLVSFVDSSVTCEMLDQNNNGSSVYAQFAAGKVGTLTWAPAGTAAGKIKHTLPAICMGYTIAVPFKDVVTITVNWAQSAVQTLGTY